MGHVRSPAPKFTTQIQSQIILRYEIAVTPNPSVKKQEGLRCLYDKTIHINSHSNGIVGLAVAVEPPALNEVIVAAAGLGGEGLELVVERAGCDAYEVQTNWTEGGGNNRSAVFKPASGATTCRLLGLKEGLVAHVNAAACGGRSSLAGAWVAVLANKGGRNLEETVFSADLACTSPHWAVCTINDLLALSKIDKKMAESPAGGAAVSICAVAVKQDEAEAAAAATLEIFEGAGSSDEKNLGAVKVVYSGSEPGGGRVFLNWGTYWAVMQGNGLLKSSFPFDVTRERDSRLSVAMCPTGVLGPKQARLVLTWAACLQSGATFSRRGPKTKRNKCSMRSCANFIQSRARTTNHSTHLL